MSGSHLIILWMLFVEMLAPAFGAQIEPLDPNKIPFCPVECQVQLLAHSLFGKLHNGCGKPICLNMFCIKTLSMLILVVFLYGAWHCSWWISTKRWWNAVASRAECGEDQFNCLGAWIWHSCCGDGFCKGKLGIFWSFRSFMMFNRKSPSSIIIDKSSMNDHFNHFLYSHVKNNQW